MNVVEAINKNLDGANNVLRNRIALIPAYNEARFIGSVVLQALMHVDRVVVIDDGSVDETAQIAEEAGADVLSLAQNMGKANSATVCPLARSIRSSNKMKPTSE